MKMEVVPITISVRLQEARKEFVDRNGKEQTEREMHTFFIAN
ncbi:hypothetical protein CDLVIII_5891 [Clostridium sp. DL-VIII]|nr:hypothetical protein [Clostridium sp. DL-VIII]EHJ02354.1 hypothetical protein CDLVIII_5891 [Clostridium sp. DL-VIII]